MVLSVASCIVEPCLQGRVHRSNATKADGLIKLERRRRRKKPFEGVVRIVACDCAEPRRLAPEVDAIPWRDVPTFLSGVFPT